MQLEGVSTVAVSCIFLQVAREIDNVDGVKWTFLNGMRLITGNHLDAYATPTLVHMPHPMHSVSEIVAILSVGTTSIHSFPAQHTSTTVKSTQWGP